VPLAPLKKKETPMTRHFTATENVARRLERAYIDTPLEGREGVAAALAREVEGAAEGAAERMHSDLLHGVGWEAAVREAVLRDDLPPQRLPELRPCGCCAK
jgi:hypothetical protein